MNNPSTSKQVQLFGMTIDTLNLQEATSQVVAWAQEPSSSGCRFVVTPNVDHSVLFQHHAGLRAAYADAAMVVADGAPLVVASRLLGKPLPERVAGSDLAPEALALASFAACEQGERPLRVFLLGAGPGVAERAALRIGELFPGVETVGTHCPPLGFENDADATRAALEAVAAATPDLLLVGLGAPKQELWVHQHREALKAQVALCVGATIDFLAGEKHRSPRWMQRVGLEWAHRLLSEPRRLASRYARDAWIFPQLVWAEYWGLMNRSPSGR